MKPNMWSWLAAIGISVSAGLPSSSLAQQAGPEYQLFLAGDELALCSSMAWQHCDDTNWIDNTSMRTDRYLNLTDKYVKPLLADERWPQHRRETRDDVADAIVIIRNRLNEDIVPERVFLEEFTRRATRYLYDNLSEREWNLVVDHLEMPVPQGKTDTARLDELVLPAKRDILEAFIRQASLVKQAQSKDDKVPTIVIAAVGARDPFTAVEPFLSGFAQAGANVQWLPLDAAVNTAQRTKQCNELEALRETELGTWHRARVHADKHRQQLEFCNSPLAGIKMIDQADGLFIVGNDPSLVRAALLNPLSQPTDIMTSIYLKMKANRLVVGATSDAMNALTARAMVASGTSAEALRSGAIAGEAPPFACNKDDSCPRNMNQDSVSYHPLGGVGLFEFASLDGQFSDLGRHGRLLSVAATTATPLAVGIDARTALAVNVHSGAFTVLGERGVFFAPAPQQVEHSVVSAFHYLTAGASGQFVDNDISNVTFAKRDNVVQEDPTTRFLNKRGAVDSLRLICQQRDQFNLIENEFRLMVIADDATQRQKSGGECQVMNARMGISWQPEKF
ncbi:cyanophycinase [Pseudidiomarina sp. PP-1MA]|uniref:Cyanophycinase n=1 Tax=Pseudidiomarina sp. PP-1MA TaxID=3237706 RepID=A0AB39X840_9GAMM